MVLILLQWNARSLISNGQEFKKYIDKLEEKPDVICIQETWLKPQLDFIIKGYNAVRRDRESGRGGGVVTFIQNGMSYKVMRISTEHESITVKVWSNRGNIDIINYYNPCGEISLESLEEVVGVLDDNVILCGDFNSHSSLWGSSRTDLNGLVVEEFIDNHCLVCINNGEGTRYNSMQNTEAALDLTLVSSEIAGLSTWNVIKYTTIGSDHYPVVTKIGMEGYYEKGKKIPRWKLGDANWEVFQKISANRFCKLKEENQTDVNIINSKIVKEIIQSAEETIPKSNGTKRTKSVPWWNDNCSKAIKARNKAFRELKKLHSQDALIQYKRAQALVRRTIRIQKRTFWRKYCNTIGREVQLSDVWGMIKRMGGIRRNYEIPVLDTGNKLAVNNLEKAELLAQTFERVHSSCNLTDEARQCRERIIMENPNITEKREMTGEPLDLPFNMFELRRAIMGARQTTPGKDGVCYGMLGHMADSALDKVLGLFNKVWDIGQLPLDWKQAIIVPILKPGKDQSDPSSYRPIALTSHLCKIMERMVTERLTYYLESKALLYPYQSGFRRGRNTMDSVLCLESDIRKAQTNKEILIAVFFDVEKAYDMLWKEGLLIKLKSLGIGGRIYNWVMNFLFDREIQVRVGSEYSSVYKVENGTPQGSVCSPLLFNIMINDIFSQLEQSVGKSLYADDGALWVRGRNVLHVSKKMQAAIVDVEKWANKWGFKLSVEKTKVICFSRRHKVTPISMKLYEQPLELVKTVRFLGVWFDEKLTWNTHLDKVKNKCKKVINILRCLSGQEWGASRVALQNIYWALMRSVFDYGCIAYMSAAESNLKKLDVIQAQALRICSGSFKTSPVSAMQVEMGEMPLGIRRVKLMMAYWVNIQGQSESHPAKSLLIDCWEHNKTNFISFGWIGDAKAEVIGLRQLDYSSTVIQSSIPPWLFPTPRVDLDIQQELKDMSKKLPESRIVQNYFDLHFADSMFIFTDGSKDPDTGRAGAAVYIPASESYIKKRISDNVSVYTTELIAILMALQWIEEKETNNTVIASDSLSALMSIKSGKSLFRSNIINDIFLMLYRMELKGLSTCFLWVPAHVGVEGNEQVDMLAKGSLKNKHVDLRTPLNKEEAKSIIRKYAQSVWQGYWDNSETGRHLYNVQRQVGAGRMVGWKRREESLITRLRIGHTGLNLSLYKIGKHPTGKCTYCNQPETVEHVLLQCRKYNINREHLFQSLRKAKHHDVSLSGLLGKTAGQMYCYIIRFLKETELIKRI